MTPITYIEDEIIKTLAVHTQFAHEGILEAYDITHSIDRTLSALALASCLNAPLSTAAHAVARDDEFSVVSVVEPGKPKKLAQMYFARDDSWSPGECVEGELPREFWCVFVSSDQDKLAQFISLEGIMTIEKEEE